MDKPKIFIGADHNGFELKATLTEFLQRGGYEVIDCGDTEKHPDDDFPQFASKVVKAMEGDPSFNVKGILMCGSGQGMCMAANRFKGVRASLVWDAAQARNTRNDNNSNILCLPADLLEDDEPAWQGIIATWLNTPFAGAPRYVRRNAQLDEIL